MIRSCSRRIAVLSRPLLLAVLAVAVLGGAGCSWFHKKTRGVYAMDESQRPLEVPPDLSLPSTTGAVALPALASAQAAGAAQVADNRYGFTLAESDSEKVYARVGELLGGIAGLTVANRAPLLGAYDVSYQGSNFLVRVAKTASGTAVSAIDPRGQFAQGEGPAAVVATLKQGLATP
jgi:uncharacterized lipoprotein